MISALRASTAAAVARLKARTAEERRIKEEAPAGAFVAFAAAQRPTWGERGVSWVRDGGLRWCYRRLRRWARLRVERILKRPGARWAERSGTARRGARAGASVAFVAALTPNLGRAGDKLGACEGFAAGTKLGLDASKAKFKGVP